MTTRNNADLVHTDFLVIGSGIAGLTFALTTAQYADTLVLTKKSRAESNTNWAQGGIASVLDQDDREELHFADTLTAGAGLCDPSAVKVLVHEGPDRVRDLMRLGAQFTHERGAGGIEHLALGREGGHSRNRIVFAADRTGWECERTLLEACERSPRLTIYEHDFVVDLLLADTPAGVRCVGASTLHQSSGQRRTVVARCVLLSTGGCGQVYRHTTNPAIATGDGVAMAYRAGARIANMEFIQFHPTTLYHPEGNSFLISEAVRGEGGILRTADGSTFAEKYHPMGALAPRDIVARAIDAERKRLGEPCVYLDVTHLDADWLRERFPTIHRRCAELRIDITRQPIPVVPAAHYACGGVMTDLYGRTDIPGLYAAGEVAWTGVHGANRLASNSLLEAMVFGRRAAETALECEKHLNKRIPFPVGSTPEAEDTADTTACLQQLREIMDTKVGIVRTTEALQSAKQQLEAIGEQLNSSVTPHSVPLLEARNLAAVAAIIVEGALHRRESRGLHFTLDYPQQSAHPTNTIIRADPDGRPNAVSHDPGGSEV